MLDTEDTYELPGEPYFGYQRGAYSAEEIKVIDDYAARLNIEIVPCIQTLGHLEKILRHSPYHAIWDTQRIMFVGEEKTYTLIEKMIRFWKESVRTSRIHIGMDETSMIGRGKYLDRHGYRPGFDLFNEHLAKVVEICGRHGLKPMIWSDTYFRLGSVTSDYYDYDGVIPDEVVKKIPEEAELVYWDYYHDDREFYLEWFKRHRAMGKEPIMASGIWTWDKYWYDHRLTESNAGACIDACYEAKIKELILTQWGDNGAYCDHDSAFAGMVFCADKAYGHRRPGKGDLEKRFSTVCGGSYAAHHLAGKVESGIDKFHPDMWDDPIFETKFRAFCKDDTRLMRRHALFFGRLAEELKKYKRDRTTGDMGYAHATAKAFAERYKFSASLLRAYRKGDKKSLAALLEKIPETQRAIKGMSVAFRRMWMSHNKPQGMETIQARFGMVHERYSELSKRMKEYLEGSLSEIPELDCHCPPVT